MFYPIAIRNGGFVQDDLANRKNGLRNSGSSRSHGHGNADDLSEVKDKLMTYS